MDNFEDLGYGIEFDPVTETLRMDGREFSRPFFRKIEDAGFEDLGRGIEYDPDSDLIRFDGCTIARKHFQFSQRPSDGRERGRVPEYG